jgi:L-ribulose-5-phosphate 3-epimerase
MNRRQFMALGAGASLAASVAAEQAKQFRKGICYVIFPASTPVEEMFARTRDAGFEGLELAMSKQGPIAPDSTPADMERLAAQAGKAGIEITDVMVSTLGAAPLTSPDPALRDQGVAFVKKALELAVPLGVTSLLVVPGRVGSGPRLDVGYEEAWKNASDSLRRLAPLAEKQKVALSIENVWNKFLLSPLEMRSFVDQFQTPWVGVHFDVGNVVQWGYPQDWIRTLGPRIKRVHIKDYKLAQKAEPGGFVSLLEGDVDWKAVMAALRATNYNGWLIPEIGSHKNEPDYIRTVSGALTRIIAL